VIPAEARFVRIPLPGRLAPAQAALLVADDPHPFALTGDWAGAAAIAGGDPLRIAGPDDDPFALLDRRPAVSGAPEDGIGGGWFGLLGYGLGRRVERVPPPPPAPERLPDAVLAFHDHVLRADERGNWWFEALWTPARARALSARQETLAARLLAAPRARAFTAGPLTVRAPGAGGHRAAIAACRERIAAGDLFQANLALRLEGAFAGEPAGLAVQVAERLPADQGAFLAGPWGALVSASPEVFLRRRGRDVRTLPIKGTAPADASAALAGSAKDHAENVMIVDLMRNDLGRVCEYGSVEVEALAAVREGAGVAHLVSEVRGTLRRGTTDAELLRATFPPGSVTGAPKVQALTVIAELESSARQAYTGAIGMVSPVAGLALSVAIRTFELRGDRIWLGAGGGITFGSDPDAEVEECLVKARPVAAAAGTRILPSPARRAAPPAVPAALGAGGRTRPEPRAGVFETLRVEDGRAVALDAHLARLAASVHDALGLTLDAAAVRRLPELAAATGAATPQRLRILAAPDGRGGLALTASAAPFEPPGAAPEPVALTPWMLPGGLGRHKWADRRLVDALTEAGGATPLLLDADGGVLEAGWASVWLLDGDRLRTAPDDGRILPGVTRARLLALAPGLGLELVEEAPALDDLAGAPGLFVSSALRMAVPARVLGAGAPEPDPRIAELAAALVGTGGRGVAPR
jgi:para-aminobenzoate synthetase/4-amino-4-deoxychorismate lyase